MASAPAGSGTPPALSSIASGKKYMLAIECSKPAATKAEIGTTMATALSTTLRPAIAIHTAMHTRMLHSTPRKKAAQAMASRLLPVKSSAPATTTSKRPSEKHTPPSTRDAANPSVASLATKV